MRPERLLGCAVSLWLMGVPTVFSATPRIVPVQFSREEQTNINVYQTVSPAVVTIAAGRSSGSGSIVSPDGLVLTNEHVIRSANGGRVTVKTANGRSYSGQVIATDRQNDLALIRLATSDRLPTVPLADASGIQVGQQVYAIGSPFGLSGTLTTGILNRIGQNGDLQTDATLNPGNSGGPLLNSRGEMVGINKAILIPRSTGNRIGFATSALVARNFIAQNRNNTPGTAVARQSPSTPRMGISLDAATLVIQAVERGSLADRVGLRPGDRLLGLNGRPLRSIEELLTYLERRPSNATLTIGRNQRLANVRVTF